MKKNILGLIAIAFIVFFGGLFMLYLIGQKEIKILENRRQDAPVFSEKTVRLNTGYDMPVIGYNAWSQGNDTAAESAYFAIKAGYRMIEAVQADSNEEIVNAGIHRAIDEGIVKREDLFITTRISPENAKMASKSIEQSLQNLGLDYIDLVYIQQPSEKQADIYRAMEKYVDNGKVHSLGLANFHEQDDIDDILVTSTKLPAVIEDENHIYYQNPELRDYIAEFGIVLVSWRPFDGFNHTANSLKDETIIELANKYNVTPAQLILRWHIQSHYVPMPGSSNVDYINEDLKVFDFNISSEDIAKIWSLNRD